MAKYVAAVDQGTTVMVSGSSSTGVSLTYAWSAPAGITFLDTFTSTSTLKNPMFTAPPFTPLPNPRTYGAHDGDPISRNRTLYGEFWGLTRPFLVSQTDLLNVRAPAPPPLDDRGPAALAGRDPAPQRARQASPPQAPPRPLPRPDPAVESHAVHTELLRHRTHVEPLAGQELLARERDGVVARRTALLCHRLHLNAR